MKCEKVLCNTIHYLIDNYKSKWLDLNAIIVIQEALSKQIPLKPDYSCFVHSGGNTCPLCQKILDNKYNFCPDCGQALNWEEN